MDRKFFCNVSNGLVPVKTLETKSTELSGIKAGPDGVFEGYASLFNIEDLGGDIVMPGAFDESLRARTSSGIKLLWQHDLAQPLGTWLSINEDRRGLRVKGRLNLEVAKSREILSLMREGAVDGLSIGFRTKAAHRDKKMGVRRLYKLDLWEISLVTFPMLVQARVEAVKRGSINFDGSINGGELAHVVDILHRTSDLMRI